MAETGARVDPYRNFNFLVEIDGIARASFSECSGLDCTTEVIEHREGGQNTTVYKLPGKTTYSDITLKWGLSDSRELWEWRKKVIEGALERKNGSIVVFDLDNKREVARFDFVRAWPTKWEGPSLSAKGSEVAIESLVLTHEGLSRV